MDFTRFNSQRSRYHIRLYSFRMAAPPPRAPQAMSESNEQERPRRRFWQIHLSTAVLMTLIAGFAMYENIVPHRLNCFSQEHPELPDVFGWPFPIVWGNNGYVWLREDSRNIPWTLGGDKNRLF